MAGGSVAVAAAGASVGSAVGVGEASVATTGVGAVVLPGAVQAANARLNTARHKGKQRDITTSAIFPWVGLRRHTLPRP